MTNHAKKVVDINTFIDGQLAHILIMGLQQALFIENESEPKLNDYILKLAVKFIDALAMGNSTLKECYLTGFPCKYLKTARDQLHLE
ncbi:hypothetical protein [Crocosphaera sp.]|uniref:hypothetical protein n=1 Tax=Crocosphaera sp. TaxID=2729996 RepID=UPI003F21076D|nr:hypothetical protein [Crocosphaera sp.]